MSISPRNTLGDVSRHPLELMPMWLQVVTALADFVLPFLYSYMENNR